MLAANDMLLVLCVAGVPLVCVVCTNQAASLRQLATATTASAATRDVAFWQSRVAASVQCAREMPTHSGAAAEHVTSKCEIYYNVWFNRAT